MCFGSATHSTLSLNWHKIQQTISGFWNEHWHTINYRNCSFRPFDNVQSCISTLCVEHGWEKTHISETENLSRETRCVFFRFFCHSSDNFQVRNHISCVIFGLWLLCLAFFLVLFFRSANIIHLQSLIHSLALCCMTKWAERTMLHLNTEQSQTRIERQKPLQSFRYKNKLLDFYLEKWSFHNRIPSNIHLEWTQLQVSTASFTANSH